MSISIPDFWKLAIDSQLLDLQQCRQYGEAFGNVKGAATQSNARTLVEWLVADNVLSRYQAQVLLAGRAGPFVYGEYKVYDRIKRGLARSVFPAVHMPSQHPVTLFFLPQTETINGSKWAEVLEGSAAAIAIQHPNVGRCHELLDAGGYKFVVMEHLSGETAAERLTSRGALPPEEACYVVHQVALGLSQFHNAGRIHGELQPSSIWLGDDGTIKLLQTPLARLPFTPPGVLDRSASPQTLLAADYAAPELIQADRARDELTDLYSLGCTFYELLSGHVPFAGDDLQQKLTCHATKAIDSLDAQGVTTQPLAQVVTYMMAKDPSVRYQNAAALVETVAVFVDPARWQKPTPLPPATLATFDSALLHRKSTQIAMRPTAPPDEDFNIDVSGSAAKPSDTPITSFPTVVAPSAAGAAAVTSTVESTVVAVQTTATAGETAKTASAADRFGNKKASRSGLWIALVAVALALVTTAILGLRGCEDETPEARENNGKSTGNPPTTPDKSAAGGASQDNEAEPTSADTSLPYELIDDDGSHLWAPPTQGTAADLAYLSPGAQIVFIARPADILAHGDDEVLIGALGPFGPWMRQSLETLAGIDMQQVERLVIGVRDENDQPTLSLVVYPRGASGETAQRHRWKLSAAAAQHDGKTYYRHGTHAYYEIGGGGFAVAPAADIADVIDAGASAPPFSRQMEQLLRASDADRHLTVLFQPAYLRNQGHHLFRGYSHPLGDAIDLLLGSNSDVSAGLLSLHFDPMFFGELRLIGSVDAQPEKLARKVYERLRSAQRKLSAAYGSGAKLSLHGRAVLSNYPRIVDRLINNTRYGADGPQAVLRFYLQPSAAHHLVMGTELALYESADPPSGIVTTPTATKTLREKLKQSISMSFDKEELQVALAMFEEESGVDVQILGKDLEREGITRNKSVTNFQAAGRPADEVLRMLLIQGNPTKVDRTDDPQMKLVYVIRQDTATGREAVFLTTRSAAAQRKEKLPPEFAIEP